MSCPFQNICINYNFLVDRGEQCQTQLDIVKATKQYEKKERKKRKIQAELQKGEKKWQ